jgi:septal ring factor EnvC (AmiA/AmiB activator)
MANNKIDRINKEIAKTREKITEYQNKLKGLEAQKTEAENLEIVQLVRAMRMTPQELNAMLKGDTIPGMTATDYEEQEDNADEE